MTSEAKDTLQSMPSCISIALTSNCFQVLFFLLMLLLQKLLSTAFYRDKFDNSICAADYEVVSISKMMPFDLRLLIQKCNRKFAHLKQ